MSVVRKTLSWLLALFLVVALLTIVDWTLFPPTPSQNVVFPTLAERSGYALFEPTGRLATCGAEILAVLLLVLPPTRRMGAALSLCVSGCAVALHASPWLGIQIPLEMGSAQTDGGRLFNLALAVLASSLLLALIHPGRRARAR